MAMTKDPLWPDFAVALVIMLALFWMMIVLADTARGIDVSEPRQPECRDMYQLTTKEVLSCE